MKVINEIYEIYDILFEMKELYYEQKTKGNNPIRKTEINLLLNDIIDTINGLKELNK